MCGELLTNRAKPEQVASYQMNATLNPTNHTVYGEGIITWRNTSLVPTRELWVHLYLNAFKNSASVFMQEAVSGFRGGQKPTDWGKIEVQRFSLQKETSKVDLWAVADIHPNGDQDETDIRIPLPDDVKPGDELVIDVAWEAKLPSIVLRTGYWDTYHFMGQWFPKIARLETDGKWSHFPFHRLSEFYADYAHYDVTLDVPEQFTIGATGPIIEESIANGRRRERHVQDSIHDFAWSAWDQWQSRKETIGHTEVTVFYPKGFHSVVERQLATLRFAFPYYQERYGTYPYSVLTVIHPPEHAHESGGMEYPTLITTGGAWYTPSSFLMPELVTIHEFGHQYFYGLLGSNEVEWPFLDEGLNAYAEQEALAHFKGSGSFINFFGLTISDTAHALTGNQATHQDRVAQPAFLFQSGTTYGKLVYSRTSTLLETLRRVYGDEKMRAALTLYAHRYRFLHPTPDQLLDTLGQCLGDAARENAHLVLFERGWVDYRAEAIASHPTQDREGFFDQTDQTPTNATNQGKDPYTGWVLVTRRGTLHFPITIELISKGGFRQRIPWEGIENWIRIPYRGATPLEAAIVDPDEQILLDQDRTHQFITTPTFKGPGLFRTGERLFYWVQVLLQWLLP
ncbi:M1 family metallopeptidase [Pajaroellobacter abortibovis]|uniref:Peptidase M1 membrane alanine aminopeptidase domain-containing protein n=1 Tax=Pajaroellobacter abortibovis TaxID=1882918 RepID=A0A1L6MXI7_9BACT|nr:M1 family metallopeptidase [Pajaroellobacter abortibovis]APS00220.1 hypothetical protein BCY86_05645 [Pajaroellobacter abortibovis]